MTVRFFYPTAAGHRKTRIRNRPMLLVLLHSVYVSLSKISIIARTKTRPLEKRGVPLFADAKVRTFTTPTKYFCNFFRLPVFFFLNIYNGIYITIIL